MEREQALEMLRFLLECKEGQTAEYINANEAAFLEAVCVAAGCIQKQLHFQRVIHNTVFECFLMAQEE